VRRVFEVAMAFVFALFVAFLAELSNPPAPSRPAATPVAHAASRPSPAVLGLARAARAEHLDSVTKTTVFAIVDYDVSWREDRLWILDTATNSVLFRGHARHAAASDDGNAGRAVDCGNVAGSLKSSPGAFVTQRAFYRGRYGRSLRVYGLEPGVNDNAVAREIVFHPAGHYIFSAGCFMIPDDEAQAALDHLVGGVFVFAHGCRGGGVARLR
jgi:hypothetical protein